MVSDAFFRYVVTVTISSYRGPTHRGGKSGVVSDTFCGYSYDGVSAAIGVQHTEVANLGVVSDAFFPIGGYCYYQLL